VLVGDASNRTQFRLVDPHHEGVMHPEARVALFKIQPVTFEGFFPATINKDPNSTRAGQNLTIASYGRTDVSSDTPPGEVYETSVQARKYDERSFLLFDPEDEDVNDDIRAPCSGAYDLASFAYMPNEPEAP
jgi:hypothetical protein